MAGFQSVINQYPALVSKVALPAPTRTQHSWLARLLSLLALAV
jgi:hypothetical protein